MDNLNAFLTHDVIENLGKVILLAMVLERSSALLFESRWWKQAKEKFPNLLSKSFVSFLVSLGICYQINFDILVSFTTAATPTCSTSLGMIVTAALIAGGSKGAIRLFQGYLGFSQEAVRNHVKQTAEIAGKPAATSQQENKAKSDQ
ncbi:hypothetical protein [Curvivirga sp.]|uniref:hypothetical protein n=1 Tax=Curvivirga sp. TaxID=2856848 RepID=UPI003B593CA6